MEGMVILRRVGDALTAANDDAVKLISKLKEGQDILVTLEQDRSIPEQRFYWGMVQHVADAIGTDKDVLHAQLRHDAGLYALIQRPDGKKYIVLESTASHALGQQQFHDYVVKARRILARMVDLTEDELSDEVCGNTGVPPMDMREPQQKSPSTMAAASSGPGTAAPAPVAAPVVPRTAAAGQAAGDKREPATDAAPAAAAQSPRTAAARARPRPDKGATASQASPPAAAAEPTERPKTYAGQEAYVTQFCAWAPTAAEDALEDHMKRFHSAIVAIRQREKGWSDRLDAALAGRQ